MAHNIFTSVHSHLTTIRIFMSLTMAVLVGMGAFIIFSAVRDIVVLVEVISLATMMFITLMFLGYDILRNHHDSATSLVLESKRLFIRYVSREIRSPLNTAHLGLKLLVQEMQELMADNATGGDVIEFQVMKSKFGDWVALIDEIEESTERVVAVLNELIYSDELATGSLHVSRKSVNFWEVVEGSVQLLRGQAAQKEIHLILDMEIYAHAPSASEQPGHADEELELESDLEKLRVVGDNVKLQQVMGMLLGVAMQNAGGGGQVAVSVFWEARGQEEEVPPYAEPQHDLQPEEQAGQDDSGLYDAAGTMVVLILSSGPGSTTSLLPPQGASQLSTQDGQFNVKYLHAGGGELELWICKRIIEMHGGRLTVIPSTPLSAGHPKVEGKYFEKEGGEGGVVKADVRSGVRMELPAVTMRPGMVDPLSPHASDVGMKEMEAFGTQSSQLDLSYNVLVVEDSAPSRKVLCRLLSNLGCRCTQAENGIECIDIVHKQMLSSHSRPPFDFILMDYEMPQLDGPHTARALRSEGIFTPIIGITGNVLPEDQQYFLHSGANRVLRKPLSMSLLEKTLVDMIMRKDEISYIM